jgi:hypothetical protein
MINAVETQDYDIPNYNTWTRGELRQEFAVYMTLAAQACKGQYTLTPLDEARMDALSVVALCFEGCAEQVPDYTTWTPAELYDEANGLLTLIATSWDGHYTLTPSDHARIEAHNVALQRL